MTDEALVAIIAELTYRNYAHNRTLSPEVTPEQWAGVYGETMALEARYQREHGLMECFSCGALATLRYCPHHDAWLCAACWRDHQPECPPDGYVPAT